MVRVLLTFLLVALIGSVAGGWYLFYGPVQGLEKRGAPTAVADVVSEADPEDIPPASPLVRVEPSEELIDEFPAQMTIVDGERRFTCHYTGNFLRIKKIIFDIKSYRLASYVLEPETGTTAKLFEQLLIDGKPKVYLLRFTASLPGRQIMNDIYSEINESFVDVDVDRLKPSIDEFCQQFQNGSKVGDTVYMVWLPGGKAYSSFNKPDDVELLAEDMPFARALWRIWTRPKFGDVRFDLVSRYADNTETK